MGMNLSNLFKMMKCAGSEDILTMQADDNADTVKFNFEDPKQGRLAEFELKLMSIDSEHLGIPDSEYAAIVKLPSSEFQRIVRDLSTIGDTVNILVTKDGIKFGTSGDIGKGEIMVRHDASADKEEDKCLVDLSDEPVQLTFALRYLLNFAKATPLSNQVVLQMSKDLPIVVEYEMADIGHIRFYLAPKVDDEDGDES